MVGSVVAGTASSSDKPHSNLKEYMRKLQLVVTALVRSVIDPRYFKDVYHSTWRFSLLFFTLVVMLMSGLMAGVSARWLAHVDISRIPQEALAAFPNDLELQFSTQGLSVNKPLPYSIPVPANWPSDKAQYQNLVTFVSASASPTMDDIALYRSIAVISPSEVYIAKYNDENSLDEVRQYAIPGFDETLILNRPYIDQQFLAWFDHPFFAQKWYAWLIGTVLFMVLVPFLWIFQMVVYAIISLLFWLVTRLVGAWKHLSYGQIYRISMVMLTFALVGDVILDFLDLNYVKFPWLWVAGVLWLSLGAYLTFGLEAPMESVSPVVAKTRRQGKVAPRAKKR